MSEIKTADDVVAAMRTALKEVPELAGPTMFASLLSNLDEAEQRRAYKLWYGSEDGSAEFSPKDEALVNGIVAYQNGGKRAAVVTSPQPRPKGMHVYDALVSEGPFEAPDGDGISVGPEIILQLRKPK